MIKLNIWKKLSRGGIFFLLTFLFLNINAQQNLVPNGSFEDTVHCPWTGNQLNFAKFWVNPSTSTPDYLNNCSQWMKPPKGARTGVGCAGMYNFEFSPPTNKGCEAIQSILNDSLIAGKNYCVSFHVLFSTYYAVSCSDLGAFLSTNAISSGTQVLPYSPQIANPINNFITDTTNWTRISGIFNSIGGEKYITITNFNLMNDTFRVDYGPQQGSYFYIDDVSVVEVTPAFAGNDTTYCSQDTSRIGGTPTFGADYVWTKLSGSALMDSNLIARPKITATSSGASIFVMQKTQCSVVTYDTVSVSFNCVGIEEIQKKKIKVYPNPTDNTVFISLRESPSENLHFVLYDVMGKLILNKMLIVQNGISELDVKEIPAGIYFYKLTSGETILKQERLIISK